MMGRHRTDSCVDPASSGDREHDHQHRRLRERGDRRRSPARPSTLAEARRPTSKPRPAPARSRALLQQRDRSRSGPPAGTERPIRWRNVGTDGAAATSVRGHDQVGRDPEHPRRAVRQHDLLPRSAGGGRDTAAASRRPAPAQQARLHDPADVGPSAPAPGAAPASSCARLDQRKVADQ